MDNTTFNSNTKVDSIEKAEKADLKIVYVRENDSGPEICFDDFVCCVHYPTNTEWTIARLR